MKIQAARRLLAQSPVTIGDLAKAKKIPVTVKGSKFTLKFVKARMGINIYLEGHGMSTRISGGASPKQSVADWLKRVKEVHKAEIKIDPKYFKD